MQKTNFDKGRAERLKKLEKFKEKPVKHPGRSMEENSAPVGEQATGRPRRGTGSEERK